MPTHETPTNEGATAPEMQGEQPFKTIAVRVSETTHAQLSFIAQLSGASLSDEVRQAVDVRIEAARTDPELIARAEQARDRIERQAAIRTAALSDFLGKPAVAATTSETRPARRGQPGKQ